MKKIESMCQGLRLALEPGFPGFDAGKPRSSGTCLYASFALRYSLEKFANCTAVIRGGDGQDDGGALGSDGAMYGHYWVEAQRNDGLRFVADITADQFGYPPVVVLSLDESIARYRPGDQSVVDKAAADLAEEFEQTAKAI